MNCANCGAPMTLARDRDFFHCDFCSTYHFPAESGDGVRRLGEPGGSSCPICHVQLVAASVDGFRVLSCARCEGVLFPLPTFAIAIQLRKAERDAPPAPPTHSIDSSELRRQIHCPQCGKPMATHPYHGGGAVVIDNCDPCGLIWLDRGEIARIARST